MSFPLDLSEVARSIEIYNMGKQLQAEAATGKSRLGFVREPFLRRREEVGNVVVVFGSFDPLSRAHEALFLRSLDIARQMPAQAPLTELLIVTPTTHFNKKIDYAINSSIYDRIHSLEGFASCYGNISLAIFNHPLYVALAPAVQCAYGNHVNVSFSLGVDVMEKIVDPKGYEGRDLVFDDVMHALFQHSFLVNEREMPSSGAAQQIIITLDDLKIQYPHMQAYDGHLIATDIRGEYAGLEVPIQHVSSTLIRHTRSAGENARSLVAVGIGDFVDRRSLYLQDPSHYQAFAYARERFADSHTGQPIASYIETLMDHLRQLDVDPALRELEITMAGKTL